MTKEEIKREQLEKALTAWAKWYSNRLDLINKGSRGDYSGYE